ncbi:MAG: hypothetical protein H6Q07_2726, partial [Acidobacteria bacterium]|nr:hypothetical protein [Acidobacteriota bacterium]
MKTEIFDSSDSARSALPLKYARYFTFDGPLQLELGQEIQEITVAYETYGQL